MRGAKRWVGPASRSSGFLDGTVVRVRGLSETAIWNRFAAIAATLCTSTVHPTRSGPHAGRQYAGVIPLGDVPKLAFAQSEPDELCREHCSLKRPYRFTVYDWAKIALKPPTAANFR
jgi:hypothetical protein